MKSSLSSFAPSVEPPLLLMPDIGLTSGDLSATFCRIWVLGEDPQKRAVLSSLLEECERISPLGYRFSLQVAEDSADVCVSSDKDICFLWNVSEDTATEILAHSQMLPPVVVVLDEEYGASESAMSATRHLLKLGVSDCLSQDELLAPTLVRAIRLALMELAGRSQRAQRKYEAERHDASITANVPGVVFRLVRETGGAFRFDFVSELALVMWGEECDWSGSELSQHLERIHLDDRAELLLSLQRSAREMTVWDWSGRLRDMHGEWRWVRVSALPRKREDGALVWDGLVTDESTVRNWQADLERSRRALDDAQALSGVGSFDWDVASGRVEWSDTMYRIFGYEPGAFAPTIETIIAHVHPDDSELVKRSVERTLQNKNDSMLFCIRRADGQDRFLQTHAHTELTGEGKPARYLGSVQDVTDQLVSQQALRESEERYALASRGANDGLWDWNLRTDTLYLSPRWFDMIGCPACAGEGNPQEWLGRVHPDDLPVLETILGAHLDGISAHFECEYRLQHNDGSWKWMLGRGLAVRNEEGIATRIAGSQTDISDRKHVESQLAHSAFYDSLTGLPNRALFLDRLESAIARAARDESHSFAVLFLDLDRFKNINDSLGHLAGDTLLVEAGHRFASCLRPGDTVARLGGDEFAILLEGLADTHVVETIATRVRRELEKPFPLEGHEVFITVSIGVAPAQGRQTRAVDLLRNADTAMYRAKGLGRARHATFDASMHHSAVRMLELESDLWRALERDELRLHFQPIVELATGQICGFEALVRWEHPQRGLVSPSEFIPLAEETGLIVPIGWWVLEEACRQAMEWNKAFTMAVNLSSRQFSQTDCIERVKAILAKTGFDARRLKLEITETVIMQNTESASVMLRELKEMGIALAMDDFGTGYSSLSYLHRFPLTSLKIDRSFVAQMSALSKSDPIVHTILDLARSLKIQVVAEGVESEEQVRLLRDMDCDFAQGFFFARPLTATQVEELLEHTPRW
ncbi:putative signaling protein [Abditibacteriota bacterium]|nr:putative signaling protein [Abditibacteriota bacterium]